MKQFLLKNKPDSSSIVRLVGSDFHYLVKVRRLAVGEFFPALLPDGKETQVQVLSTENNILTGKCTASSEATSSESISSGHSAQLPPIILFQALPKADKMDMVVRQAAEGGITEIIPFVSEFSIAKTGGQKFSRWERIIKEARQQSGSKIATSIRQLVTKDQLLDYWGKFKVNGAVGLLFHHQGLEQESLHSYLNSDPIKIVALAVGPEGGFSGNEVALFLENGFRPFTIGDTILRTETAALYCAAAIKILLLERDSWELKQTK